MEDSHRMSGARDVVAEHEVDLVVGPPAPRNWRHCVVRNAVCLAEDAGFGVAVDSPAGEQSVGGIDEAVGRGRTEPDHRHRPRYRTRSDPGITGHIEGHVDPRPLHREHVSAALHMVVREDRAADDRQIGIRTDEIVRHFGDEIEHPHECLSRDAHRAVRRRQHYAVLVVVDVGRILHIPALAAEPEGDLAQSLACRAQRIAGEAFVFVAEEAERVVGLRRVLCGRDVPRVLLGFREVYRDVDIPVDRTDAPLQVL